MSFLLDENLSTRLVGLLEAAGVEAVHVRDLGMSGATDEEVIARAVRDGRMLISADTDFGTILARSHATEPSFILIRRVGGRRAVDQAQILIDNLPLVQEELEAGAIVVIGDQSLRVRLLPI